MTCKMEGHKDHPWSDSIGNQSVPAVLLSGHQANIDIWRAEQVKKNTQKKRPDLLNTPK